LIGEWFPNVWGRIAHVGFVDCSKELWVVELDTRTGGLSVDVGVKVWDWERNWRALYTARPRVLMRVRCPVM
jgi:hypothetical protein